MKDFNRLTLFGQEYTKDALLLESESSSNRASWENHFWSFIRQWLDEENHIIVESSGSTGKPKKIKILKSKMLASAESTCKYLKIKAKDKALLCMSANHIGGMMMIVRAFYQRLDLYLIAPQANPLFEFKTTIDFIALVPYQVKMILEANPQKLQGIEKIIIGGGIVDAGLEKRLIEERIEAYSTFGMTETISHIALKRIAKEDYYTCLPNIQISKSDRGTLIIHAPKILDEALETNDLVEILDSDKFRWLGRLDFAIESGGLKVIPEILEKQLASCLKENYIISSLPHATLNQIIVLLIESDHTLEIAENIFESFGKYEIPKQIIFLPKFAYTKSGKIDRIKTREMIL